jgi:hypothetical protein
MNSIVGLTAARRSGATGERTTTERPPPVKAPATTAAPTTSSAQLDLDILPIGSPDLQSEPSSVNPVNVQVAL